MVGLIPSFWGIRRREDIQKNLDHLEDLTKAAFWLANLDSPVRLVAIPEGGLQGFNDEIPGHHAEYKRDVIDRQVRLMQERGIWKAPANG